MNLFITQISKREMEGKADVLFSGGYEARRSSVQCGALDYTDGQPSSHRVLHLSKEGAPSPGGTKAAAFLFGVGPWHPLREMFVWF